MKLDEQYSGNYVDGIFFTEKEITNARSFGKIRVESKRMNSNLAKLKVTLAGKAISRGANAVSNYKYGQKRTLLSLWDDTMWYAEGLAVRVEDVNEHK